MSDLRDKIIAGKRGFSSKEGFLFPIESVKDAMDDYMKECCLELLVYMAKNDIKCAWYEHEVLGVVYSFYYKGECITKDQLFENFL